MGRTIAVIALAIFAFIGVLAVIAALGMLFMHGSMMGRMMC